MCKPACVSSTVYTKHVLWAVCLPRQNGKGVIEEIHPRQQGHLIDISSPGLAFKGANVTAKESREVVIWREMGGSASKPCRCSVACTYHSE